MGLACLGLGACRLEVRLDEPRDAPAHDGGADAPVRDTPDAPPPDAPDAPARPCLAGVPLLSLASVAEARRITLAPGEDGLFALLLPPSTTGASARLVRVDGEGTVRSTRELTIVDGSGSPTDAVTLHRRQDAAGFVLLGPTELRVLDAMGDDEGAAVPLPLAPAPAFARSAGWIDAEHFVYVGAGAAQSLVRVRLTATERIAEVSSIGAAGAARVWVAPGAVTISDLAPSTGAREHDATLGSPALSIAWSDGPLAERLLGAFTGTERRWLVSDGSEFRTGVAVFRVEAAGATAVGSGTLLIGPVDVVQHDDLVSTLSGDGAVRAYDFASERFVDFGSTPSGLALIERDGAGFVWVTLDGAMLSWRCVEGG